MKKLISIMLAVMLVMSASITAFAVEEVDKYEQLKWDINEYFHNGIYDESDIDEMSYYCYGELSDGTIVMTAGGSLDGYVELVYGNYEYHESGWAGISLYKDGEFTSLYSLFTSGNLSEAVMDELCQISAQSINNPPEKYFPPFEFYRISDNGAEESDKYEQLKWEVNERYYDGEYTEDDIDDMPCYIFGELSDGTVVFSKGGHLNYYHSVIIGNYEYMEDGNEVLILYKDGEFKTFMYMYDSEYLTDQVLEELYHLSLNSIAHPIAVRHYFILRPISDNGAEEAEALYGDVDGDGVITITDATMIQKMGIGMLEVNPFGDVNGDGRVSIMDVTLVQKYIAELGYNTGNVGQPATI